MPHPTLSNFFFREMNRTPPEMSSYKKMHTAIANIQPIFHLKLKNRMFCLDIQEQPHTIIKCVIQYIDFLNLAALLHEIFKYRCSNIFFTFVFDSYKIVSQKLTSLVLTQGKWSIFLVKVKAKVLVLTTTLFFQKFLYIFSLYQNKDLSFNFYQKNTSLYQC